MAYVGDASDHYPEFRDRYRGLCAALTEAGITVDRALQANSLSVEQDGYDTTQRLIAGGAVFDGIFAGSDLVALGALRALAEAGLAVPGDVAVVGFDDIPSAGLTHPPLTTIAQDYQRAGAALVDSLIRQIAGETTQNLSLPTRLVVRASA